MNRPQTKFHTHTMSGSKVIRSKKPNLSLGQNLSVCQTYFAAYFFLFHRYFIETTTTDIDKLFQV